MNKLNIENTSGIIIGETTHTAKLISPNGGEQARKNIGINDDAAAWGKQALQNIRKTVLGNNQTLGDRADIEEAIYGKGAWTVQISN